MKILIAAVAATSFAFATPAMAVVAYNADLVHGVYYGTGNGGLPNQFTTNTENGVEIGLRAKLSPNLGGSGAVPAQLVPTGNTYFVDLGKTFNFDYSVDPGADGTPISLAGTVASLTITNLLTNASFSYNPSLGSYTSPSAPGGYQGSQRVSFPFLGLGYDPNQNNTFDISLTLTNVPGVGTLTNEIHVQVGDGFAPAVPEPSTWAMMILGFAGIGFMAYRRKQNGSELRIV